MRYSMSPVIRNNKEFLFSLKFIACDWHFWFGKSFTYGFFGRKFRLGKIYHLKKIPILIAWGLVILVKSGYKSSSSWEILIFLLFVCSIFHYYACSNN